MTYNNRSFAIWVRRKINFLMSVQEPLLVIVKRRKVAWLRHVTLHNSLSKNHPSGHLGGWATPWSAKETLDGPHQRVDIPAYVRTAHNGLPQKKTGIGSLLNRPSCSSDDSIGPATELK